MITPRLSPVRWASAVRVTISALACCAIIAGCAPRTANHGVLFQPETLAQVKVGTDTREMVVRKLGSPSARPTFDDREWYYIGSRRETVAFFAPEETEREIIVIRFRDTGVVDSIERLSLQEGQEVALVDRETPSLGKDLSLLEQFVGNIGRFNRTDEPRR